MPNRTHASAELFEAIATVGSGNHGKPMMHDGYLTVLESAPTPGVAFYDISDPYAPVLVNAINGFGVDLPEQHTYAQTSAWGGQHVVLTRGFNAAPAGGATGLAIWDWSDVQAPVSRSAITLPGIPGGYATGMFWVAVQAPYVYCPVGSLGLVIVDASDPTDPVVVKQIPKSQTGGFNVVLAFAVGNMLIVTNNDAGTGVGEGFARLDISDPENPQLLDSTTNTSSPYGASVNGGRLLVPGVDGTLYAHDLFQTGFPLINSLSIPGTRGASAVAQDGFVHVGATTAYFKADVSNPQQFGLVGGFSTLDPIRDEDWVTPMGNLVAIADDAGNGTHLVVHRTQPDVTGPVVNMVVPADAATDQALTTRVGVTLSDMVEFASVDSSTFLVRPRGGAALSGSYTHQFGVLNFSPDQPLQPQTTYEVVVPAGGLRDWSGNAVPTTFVSEFTTGVATVSIDVEALVGAPTVLGQSTTFQVASVTGPGPFQYSWSFGDGTPATPFSSSSQAAHTYTEPGHYSARVTIRSGALLASDAFVQTVHHPVTQDRPTRSSTIALDEARSRVWCVNADNDSVTMIDLLTLEVIAEVPVGAHPRTVAVAPDGSAWVACQDDASLWVLDAQGQNPVVVGLPYASAPYGVAIRPDGLVAYVALNATGELAQIDVGTRSLVGTTVVGPDPRGVAIAADSERIFVSRFRSAPPRPVAGTDTAYAGRGGLLGAAPFHSGDPTVAERRQRAEVFEVSASRFERVRTLSLAFDPGPDTEASGRGLPNYLSTLTVSPDGRRLWVPSKKDNLARGTFRSGEPLTFDSTVRTIVSQVDLGTDVEVRADRIDFNDRDMAFAVEMSPLGDYAFHALQGSNAIAVTDAYNGQLVAGVDGTGLAPQGLVMTGDGTTLFVHNFMSRSVSAFDVSGVTGSTNFAVPALGSAQTVATEALAPDVLRGKQIFYNSADPRMTEAGYISCASCHLDGGHDGRVWDFTDRGEGLRNTTSLTGRAGLSHGRVHWTANFDEIQDFEHDIRGPFRGDGFLSLVQWESGSVNQPLGTPKAGLNADLDALAAYVSSLDEFGRSPHRQSDGSLTADGAAGKVLFQGLGCATCHSGPDFTDSASGALHDVGTITPRSGQASGGPIVGLDTPTLRGLWATAPYLHDGSARTLMDVITTRNRAGAHGNTATLTARQRRELVAYLLQIDDLEP